MCLCVERVETALELIQVLMEVVILRLVHAGEGIPSFSETVPHVCTGEGLPAWNSYPVTLNDNQSCLLVPTNHRVHVLPL